MLKGFLKKFGIREAIDFIEIKGQYFLLKGLGEYKDKIKETPVYAGIYLGKKGFVPGVYLLDFINQRTKQKIIVDDKAAWLFVCGRDILDQGVIKGDVKKGDFVLVLNKTKECLGYGKAVMGNIFLKNYFDIGDFLRREKK